MLKPLRAKALLPARYHTPRAKQGHHPFPEVHRWDVLDRYTCWSIIASGGIRWQDRWISFVVWGLMFPLAHYLLRLKPPDKSHVVHSPIILNIARVWSPVGPFHSVPKFRILATNWLTTYWQLSFQHCVLVSFLASTWHTRMFFLIARWISTCSFYIPLLSYIYMNRQIGTDGSIIWVRLLCVISIVGLLNVITRSEHL